jgi:hypothetical protein
LFFFSGEGIEVEVIGLGKFRWFFRSFWDIPRFSAIQGNNQREASQDSRSNSRLGEFRASVGIEQSRPNFR